jgi:hypothetical protein
MGTGRYINKHGHGINGQRTALFFQTIIKNQLKNY